MQQRVNRPRWLGVAVLLAVSSLACATDDARVVLHTARGPVAVAVEIADTAPRRQAGMMWRRELPEGRGMLFVFPTSADHAFWMKNTLIPLDMIFIDESLHVVGVQNDAAPLSTQPLSVGRPSRYVLEVPAGWARRRGVTPGDRVDLPANLALG